MIMKNIIIGLMVLVGIVVTIPTKADEIPTGYLALLDSATNNYTGKNYSEALRQYTLVTSYGYESPEIWYNMGNCAYRLNSLAESILFYEKSLKLDPGFEDAQYNLRVVNSKILDKIDSVPQLFYERWWFALQNTFRANTWALLSLVLFVFSLVGFLFYYLVDLRWLRKTGFYGALVFLFLFAHSFAFAWKASSRITRSDYAIVFSPSVTVKGSPDATSTDLFVLHEGSKVFIGDQVGEWCKVKRSDGKEGWMLLEAIRKI